MEKTFLFDFDGTLVDSMPTYVKAVLSILDNLGVVYDEDIIKILTPLGYVGAAKYFRERYGVTLSVDEMVGKMKGIVLDAYFNKIPPKDTVVDTLKELKARGHSLNVLTASPHVTLDACLKRIGIYDLFTHVWSCEDFDTTKSDPDIYLKCAKELGVKVDEVIFLDDNYDADKTAKAAGVKVIGVYDPFSDEYVEDMKKICDGYIYKFKELLDYDL